MINDTTLEISLRRFLDYMKKIEQHLENIERSFKKSKKVFE